MSSNPLRLQTLYQKVIQNTCTQDELKEFFQLVRELSENDVLDKEMDLAWESITGQESADEEEKSRKRVARILHVARNSEADMLKIHRRKFLPLRSAGVAASFILLAMVGWWFYRQNKPAVQTVETIARASTGHQIITLPDGTRVTVNLDSKVQYPPVFDGDTREVYLSGEAFFEIAPDSKRPFLVHTGSYVTRVLGTVFNINAYPGNDEFAITVTSGKVQVSDSQRKLAVLLPNEQLIIHKRKGNTEQVTVDAYNVVEWKDEDLVFQNCTWQEAAALIEKKFGIHMLFKNPALKNCRFTGTFYSGKGIDQLLDISTSITNSTWKKTGVDTITVEGIGCEPE